LIDHPAYFSAEYIIPDGNEFTGPDKHAKVLMGKVGATFNDHPFNVEVLINPKYWDQRISDDQLKSVPNPSTIKLQFNFASLLDDQNFIQSLEPGQKLQVKVKPNGAGEPHFFAARDVRNQVLETLGVPFTANEGMGYGNQGTVHHAGGTLRMSGNGSGVVDTDLKFEQYDNLYVADPSVWPFIPAANPALTLVALSLRLADTLKQRL
jgi:GMC oxidoreductase